jgi:hypothetical protein
MKKYLFILPLLTLCSLSISAQSIKFSDLVYFTSLTNRQIYDNLVQGVAFRQNFSEDVYGQEIEHFKSINNKNASETIVVGKYSKLYNGTVLRTINYTSSNAQDILNMLVQAKRYGLELKFRGADNNNNIYLFDNNFYHVSIFLSRDQKSGFVEIKQKEYLGLE